MKIDTTITSPEEARQLAAQLLEWADDLEADPRPVAHRVKGEQDIQCIEFVKQCPKELRHLWCYWQSAEGKVWSDAKGEAVPEKRTATLRYRKFAHRCEQLGYDAATVGGRLEIARSWGERIA